MMKTMRRRGREGPDLCGHSKVSDNSTPVFVAGGSSKAKHL
jgi:hypothetical protein